MYTTTMTQPDPEMFMNQFVSWEVATKENKWQGRNITPLAATRSTTRPTARPQAELDPVKRAALFIQHERPRWSTTTP